MSFVTERENEDKYDKLIKIEMSSHLLTAELALSAAKIQNQSRA
jgi:hypothetical protein